MARVVKRPAAEADLDEIAGFIQQRSVPSAIRFLEAVDQACARLAQMPYLGGAAEIGQTGFDDLRLWTVQRFRNFVILYRPITDGIEVVRVVRASRDLESLFE